MPAKPVVLQKLKEKIDELESPDSLLYQIESQISRKTRETHLLLPPQNFHIRRGCNLTADFLHFFCHNMALTPERSGLVQKKFKKEDLPRHLGSKNRGYFFQDERGLVFPPCNPGEAHGLNRYDEQEDCFKKISTHLNCLYRFGIPIQTGFHYDVQKTRNQSLQGVQFHCALNGPVYRDGAHVNIYPNDFVR